MSQYFSKHELSCRHTGLCQMNAEFMSKLDRLREAYGKPMRISSAYRHPSHPAEAAKKVPGMHSQGRAVDVLVTGSDAYTLVKLALAHGFGGIGVQQTGDGRFIHLDNREVPAIWSY